MIGTTEGRTMANKRLTTEQAHALGAQIGPMLGYLYRLRTRIDKVGIIPDDELRRLVENAYDSMHALNVAVHYASVGCGVG
jgi:hypothetical protein